jgi:hypothetical protein
MLGVPNAPIVGVLSWAVCVVLSGRIAWIVAGTKNAKMRIICTVAGPLLVTACLWTPIHRTVCKAPETPKAQIEITKMLASPAYQTKTQEFFVNLYYANRGTLPAKGLLDHGMVKLTDRGLSTSELSDIAVDLLNDKHGTPNYEDEVQPGAPELWFTDRDPNLTDADIKAIADGTKALYLIHVMRYRDASMSDAEEGVTEFCQYYSGSLSISKICGNNRIYKRTVPKSSL